MSMSPPIRRALISVSDKQGLEDLARHLAALGVEIISTGGTARAIATAGIAVRDVSDLTGFPEIMDGRVKTLHPKVHGGLLAVRGDPNHELAQRQHDIADIDLLVVNLYPFEATLAAGGSYDALIENIDIGGPAMTRAAAKNHAAVTVIVDPEDYGPVLAEMQSGGGATTLETRRRLAAKAFARTAAYDAEVSTWLLAQTSQTAPRYRAFGGRLAQTLRYGENPHQWAAFYTTGAGIQGVATARQVQGKELSYNNINDTDAAFECVAEFDPASSPACVIVKHANPCGVAVGASLTEAYGRALACDPVSAFGGIVALNRPLDASAAREIAKIFTEVIIAPGADEEAKAIIATKKNLRLLLTDGLPDARRPGVQVKSVSGGLLVQSRDAGAVDEIDLKVVTKRTPSQAEFADLEIRLPRRQAREIERHRLCPRRRHGRHRCGSDVADRFQPHRGAEISRCRRCGRFVRTHDSRVRRRVRCLFPLRRRPLESR